MATRSLSRTKPRDYRPQLLALARYYAREEAKARIRAAGRKISHYLPKDIAVMANALLLQEPEPFITKARDLIAGGPREIHAAGSIDAVSTALGIPY
jgi:hypothetical protein